MKLAEILNNLNSFEKNSFLKILDTLKSEIEENNKEIQKILNDTSGEFKSLDSEIISKIFSLVSNSYEEHIAQQIKKTNKQIDIVTDILIKDGNSILKYDWFSRLYEQEIKSTKKKVKNIQNIIQSESSEIDKARIRDYKIYQNCVYTAYTNDDLLNQERKVTFEEQTFLNTLSKSLELSNEEVKLLNYTKLPLELESIDKVIDDLKNVGIAFFSKKQNTLYIPDEIVRIVRKIKGKSVADKHFKRVLRLIKEPQINLVCRKHGIDWKLPFSNKINEIVKEGISFSDLLSEEIFKENISQTERKKYLNELFEKHLSIGQPLKGKTIEEKVNSIVEYFTAIDNDDKVGISMGGYETLLSDIKENIKNSTKLIQNEFEIQDENQISVKDLLLFNIKPRDIIEVFPNEILKAFCETIGISTRGNLVENILGNYKDVENLMLENYTNIGLRDLKVLKENGINLKEAELGLKFEELTKKIFSDLGFEVDEKLRKQVSSTKDKIDILLRTGESEVIIIECKSVKEGGYNKFSSVSRQLKAYLSICEKKGLTVKKQLLVAPDFSDDFVKDCGLDIDLNLSLLKSNSLLSIAKEFKKLSLKDFPVNVFLRDVLIEENRVIKALSR